MTRIAAFLCLSTLAAGAQTFDVASIKPSAPPDASGRMRSIMSGGPGSDDPGRITYEGVPLKLLLTNAFNVKGYQIGGPSWLDTERFDITAKVPTGTTKEQARIMMQNLLAERFKISLHHESKEMASHVLTTGRNGPKMKVAEPEPPKDPNASEDPPARQPIPQMGKLPMGKDGFPEFPKGSGGHGGNSMIMMNGKAKLVCPSCTMSSFLDMLGNQTDKPIVDMTGLTGKYDFTLIFEPERNMGMAMALKGAMPSPPPGAGPAPEGADETAPALTTAVQDQLGLKLEPRKAPLDLIVIDHLEKTPTEN